MNSDEIRAAYLGFFEEKGHTVVPSSSLIPRGDPTLLLTSAGMVQFKPYYLGEAAPPKRRLASCQKCFRTTDIEEVGDASHLTFFEMLGNFSIGDYFKSEAIAWAWEFVARRLKLPPERLWATVFLDDDESFRYWREQGVPENRIRRFGEKDNFWGPAGDSGPCGPCSELHYDFGEEFGCGKSDCGPNCDCGRFSEIWNLVFTQYNQDKDGNRTPLPKPNIDTGMGLERTAAIMQGKASVYDTDLFTPLLDSVQRLTGKHYDADETTAAAMRVVVEHGRGIAFLIADGVMPGNEGRGYVLRRLLRRAGLFGRMLGLEKPFLNEIARITIGQMGNIYPEIVQRQDFILKVIDAEEAKFGETLNTGLELLEGVIAGVKGKGKKLVSGKKAFRLYDTYGFPVELTREVVAKSGLSVDMAGFEQEMAGQRERARAAHKFSGALEDGAVLGAQLDIQQTPFTGYHELEHSSVIISLFLGDESAGTVAEGQEASLILELTPFYGEMGGQVGDTGEIRGPSGRFVVTDTVRIPPDIVVHQGYAAEGMLTVGDEVTAVVDKERRLDIARNHTATHLLHLALRQVLDGQVEQRGSLVAPDRFRFDFSHLVAMLPEEIAAVNRIVNEKIRQNLRVSGEETGYREAIAGGAIALFDEKYGDVVRMLRIGEPAVSVELCGGTHVAATGEIGFFRIVSESSVGSGLRRIEAATGRGAEAFVDEQISCLSQVARVVGASLENVGDIVSGTVNELETERRQRRNLEVEQARKEAKLLVKQVEVVNGVNLLVARVKYSRMEMMRETSDFIKDKLKSVVIVLGGVYEDKPIFVAAVTPDLVTKGYDAGRIVGQVARVAGGGGGGSPRLGQAGGKHKDKLDEALKLVRSLI
ncbi:alanine--tRNA ligase [Chloroflexota bacterium]